MLELCYHRNTKIVSRTDDLQTVWHYYSQGLNFAKLLMLTTNINNQSLHKYIYFIPNRYVIKEHKYIICDLYMWQHMGDSYYRGLCICRTDNNVQYNMVHRNNFLEFESTTIFATSTGLVAHSKRLPATTCHNVMSWYKQMTHYCLYILIIQKALMNCACDLVNAQRANQSHSNSTLTSSHLGVIQSATLRLQQLGI